MRLSSVLALFSNFFLFLPGIISIAASIFFFIPLFLACLFLLFVSFHARFVHLNFCIFFYCNHFQTVIILFHFFFLSGVCIFINKLRILIIKSVILPVQCKKYAHFFQYEHKRLVKTSYFYHISVSCRSDNYFLSEIRSPSSLNTLIYCYVHAILLFTRNTFFPYQNKAYLNNTSDNG